MTKSSNNSKVLAELQLPSLCFGFSISKKYWHVDVRNDTGVKQLLLKVRQLNLR